MMNVTISMDDELHRKTRIEAARAGKSMSKYIADILNAVDADQVAQTRKAKLEADLAALQAVFDGPKLDMSQNGRMPDADERNARR